MNIVCFVCCHTYAHFLLLTTVLHVGEWIHCYHIFSKVYSNPAHSHKLTMSPTYVLSHINHHQKVSMPSSHTNTFHYSLLFRTSEDWNNLPSSTASINDSVTFKNALCHFCNFNIACCCLFCSWLPTSTAANLCSVSLLLVLLCIL